MSKQDKINHQYESDIASSCPSEHQEHDKAEINNEPKKDKLNLTSDIDSTNNQNTDYVSKEQGQEQAQDKVEILDSANQSNLPNDKLDSKALTKDSDLKQSDEEAKDAINCSQKDEDLNSTNNAVYKIGDDVSEFTGRPHMSAEENKALAKGNRFFHKALESSARARGDHYEPYSLPAHMRAALAQIDLESAQERMAERKKELEEQGFDSSQVELETSCLSKLHTLSSQEQEELARSKDLQSHIEAGGARFYGKYQNLLKKQALAKEESKIKVMRNIKLIGIVMLGLVGYIAYNHFMVDRNADSIESLKASLPLVIDEHTTMVRIDDRNDNFKIYFEKDPAIFAQYDEHQKEAALDQFAKNAPGLCKNPLLRSIIVSGKKVTVLLEATDRSFFREFSIDKCPSKDDAS